MTLTSPLRRVTTALRLDLFPLDSLPMKGPGRCHNGNLHLSEVTIAAFRPGESPVRRSRSRASLPTSIRKAGA